MVYPGETTCNGIPGGDQFGCTPDQLKKIFEKKDLEGDNKGWCGGNPPKDKLSIGILLENGHQYSGNYFSRCAPKK